MTAEHLLFDQSIERATCGRVGLTTTHSKTPGGLRHTSMSDSGLYLGIVLEGAVGVECGASDQLDFSDGDGFLFASREVVPMLHQIQSYEQRTVYLDVPYDDVEALSAGTFSFKGSRESLQFEKWRPDAATYAVAMQVANCPLAGDLRSLYLQGKSLELLALAFNVLDQSAAHRETARKLGAAQIERLTEAHAILLAEYRAPPNLDALARRVGLCTTALTVGFRQLFGTSVTETVQELRMTEAFNALGRGEMTVAQAAYSVGLSPAYFSTLFRRKFGCPPSHLVKRRR